MPQRRHHRHHKSWREAGAPAQDPSNKTGEQQHVGAKANGNGLRGARRLAAVERGPRTGEEAAYAHLRRKRLGGGSGGRRHRCRRRRRHRRRRRRASPRGWWGTRGEEESSSCGGAGPASGPCWAASSAWAVWGTRPGPRTGAGAGVAGATVGGDPPNRTLRTRPAESPATPRGHGEGPHTRWLTGRGGREKTQQTSPKKE